MVDQQVVAANEAAIQMELAKGFFEQGRARFEQYDYERAVFHFTQAIYVQPQHAPYYLARGSAYRMLSRDQEALEDFNSAIRFDGDLVEAYLLRASVRRDLYDLGGAVSDYERYLALCDAACAEKRAEVVQRINDLRQELARR